MAVTLNASTTTGLVQSADTSGIIEIQSNGTTKATVSSSGLAIGQYNPSTSLVTSGTAVASTSGTSIDFTSLPSWVKRITVNLVGVSGNGGSAPTIRIGTVGGVEASGYSGSSQTGGSAYLISTGFEFAGNLQSAGRLYHGSMIISLQNSSSNSWSATSVVGLSDGASVAIMGGSKSLAGTLTQVRITFVNGTDTFDAGTINILYE